MKNLKETVDYMNLLGANRIPFLFLIDFEMKKPLVVEFDQLDANKIWFDFNGFGNQTTHEKSSEKLIFTKTPVDYERFYEKFLRISQELKAGNSYLLNLTFETPVVTNFSFEQLYLAGTAKYRLLMKDEFVFFSPEIFIRTKNGKVFTHPMKGTIDASVDNAEEMILKNNKEQAEHATIVDLLRNDLSGVAKNVRVEKFRYFDRIKTHEKEILQVSSIISGELDANFHTRIGEMILSLLPAGSVSGAPKKKTVSIILETEKYERGFYTGIAGFFDGNDIDSCVIIRFLEKKNNGLVFKSGAGITIHSDPISEYQEIIDKVYVPLF